MKNHDPFEWVDALLPVNPMIEIITKAIMVAVAGVTLGVIAGMYFAYYV